MFSRIKIKIVHSELAQYVYSFGYFNFYWVPIAKPKNWIAKNPVLNRHKTFGY